jgi:IS605 OrfB family transposase
MKTILTISCKLQVQNEQVAKLEATLINFAAACNWINQSVDPKLTNNVRIQALTYEQIREQFGLSANLAIRAINRVAGNRKTAKHKNRPVKDIAPTSADYDARIFAYREKDQTVSLTLVGGRERFKLVLGNYQIGKLKGRFPTSATLVKSLLGEYFINIQVKDEAPEPIASKQVIGADLGRTDICITSEGYKASGKQITQVRNHHAQMRATLQQKAVKGTRSSRRRCRQLLQRLSGREHRFQRHVNHVVSKTLVQQALVSNSVIALENLEGIRERTNQLPRSKKERRLSNSWSFFELRQFITYKSVATGVEVVLIDPRYTSKTCHCCNIIGERKGKTFRCINTACNWTGDADKNGATNIKKLGAVLVNQPNRGSELFCSLEQVVLGLPKAPTIPLCG